MDKIKLFYEGRQISVKDFTITHAMEGVSPEIYVKATMAAPDLGMWQAKWDISEQGADRTETMIIKDVRVEGIDMGYSDEENCGKACEDKAYGNIAKKVRDLKLSEEDKLLRKHGVVFDDGSVTSQGKELLWELLLEDYKEAIVDSLSQIED